MPSHWDLTDAHIRQMCYVTWWDTVISKGIYITAGVGLGFIATTVLTSLNPAHIPQNTADLMTMTFASLGALLMLPAAVMWSIRCCLWCTG
ncbi:MAG: hypothetical protein WCN27_04255 [Alphaproteobacteria bacterium]